MHEPDNFTVSKSYSAVVRKASFKLLISSVFKLLLLMTFTLCLIIVLFIFLKKYHILCYNLFYH
jgi:hypothetical protein